jgi:hypothetical protein
MSQLMSMVVIVAGGQQVSGLAGQWVSKVSRSVVRELTK